MHGGRGVSDDGRSLMGEYSPSEVLLQPRARTDGGEPWSDDAAHDFLVPSIQMLEKEAGDLTDDMESYRVDQRHRRVGGAMPER